MINKEKGEYTLLVRRHIAADAEYLILDGSKRSSTQGNELWRDSKIDPVCKTVVDISVLRRKCVALCHPSQSLVEDLNSRRIAEETAASYSHRLLYESKDPLKRHVHRLRLEKVIRMVPSGVSTVFDAGCGEGFFLERLEQKARVGLDLSVSRLKRARDRVPDADLVLGDVYNLPFRANLFDCVICCDVLEHLKAPENALRELERVAGSKSCLVIGSPSEPGWTIARYLTLRWTKIEDHLNRFSPSLAHRFLKPNFVCSKEEAIAYGFKLWSVCFFQHL